MPPLTMMFAVLLVFTCVLPGVKPASPDAFCENPDHVPYGDFCYWFEREESYTWHESNDKCRAKGMELVSIHSQAENDFIMENDDAEKWIGLVRDEELMFRWTDGTCFDYAHWQDGEPNSEAEECVEIRYHEEWNDLDCDKTGNGFVCKTPIVDPSSSSMGASSGLTGGAVAGIVLGVSLVLVLLVVAVFLTATQRWDLAKQYISRKV